MTRAATMSLPEAEFNDFLFAPIGEDSNGMLVSVSLRFGAVRR